MRSEDWPGLLWVLANVLLAAWGFGLFRLPRPVCWRVLAARRRWGLPFAAPEPVPPLSRFVLWLAARLGR